MKALAEALSNNHCLELLFLGGNGISHEGAIAIATVLRMNDTFVSNVSAISYCLDSFRDLNNKVVDLVNNYLNYTKEAL